MNEIATEKTMTTRELADEIMSVLKKSRNHLDFVFSQLETEELNSLCLKLKYFYLEKTGFFIRVQPYFDILVNIKDNLNKQGFIYFVKDNENGYVKVGRTNNVNKRLSQLSICNNNLKVLRIVKSNNTILWEKELHNFYKNKKVFKEWFSINETNIEEGLVYLARRFNTDIDASVIADA